MNEIVDKFLLAGDRFMPEMHLKQSRFTYSSCEPFTRNRDRIQKFKEAGDKSYVYRNELDKACFQRDIAYGDFKDLARRIASYECLTKKRREGVVGEFDPPVVFQSLYLLNRE